MANNITNRDEQSVRRKSRASLFLILSVIVVILAFVFMYPAFFSGARQSALIKIPRNATPAMLADTLSKYEGEKYASHVLRLIRIRNTDLSNRVGAYRIKKGQSPFVTMRKLTSGGQSPIRLTVNGTRSVLNLAEKFSQKVEPSAASIYAAMTDPEMLASHGLTPADASALLMNDSYDVFWTDSPRQIVDKIGAVYDARWNPQRRRKAEELGLTPREVMIIASIVDEETNAVSEKGRIGRVYINRLNSGMKLQADPTVRFAVGDFTIKRVTGEHLKKESPYNTYLNYGLPPGPIRTTSLETVDKILDSKPSFEIYMCAREDFSGRHNFAVTYEDHLENARKYQEALNARGIR